MTNPIKMCPGCEEVPASETQKDRPHLCRWCGYNHETGEVAGLQPASDPFAHLVFGDDN